MNLDVPLENRAGHESPPGAEVNITRVCVEKPVFAWMIMAATLLFGGIAASRIGISQFPDVDFPTISVNVNWEGANPEVLEADWWSRRS